VVDVRVERLDGVENGQVIDSTIRQERQKRWVREVGGTKLVHGCIQKIEAASEKVK
jgi:hypothetical protein